MRRRRTVAAAAAAAVLLLAGCAEVVASKSGAGAPEQTVSLILADSPGSPAAGVAELFAEELGRASGGALSVEIRPQAHLDAAAKPGAENAYDGIPYTDVTAMILKGDAELAVVPDFTLAAAGARTLTATKAPLLVDSDDLMAAVATEMSAPLLDGVESLGIRGLALLPESLRHPVSFTSPLRTTADFEGRAMRTIDPFAGEALEALGATAVELEGEFGAAVADGRIDGAESAFRQSSTLPITGVFTSDLPLGAKFNIIVAWGAWFDTLPAVQRRWVEEAATETTARVMAADPTELEAGAGYCAAGGWVVHAGDDAISDVHARMQPLVARIANDPVAGPIYEQIIELKASLGPASAPVAPCATEFKTEARLPRDTAGIFPEGTYRAHLTVEDFTSAGVDEQLALNHQGTWTLTFQDGYVWDIECTGTTYGVADGRVVITLGRAEPTCGSIPGQELFSAGWSLEGDILRFHDIGPGASGPSMQTFSDVLWGSQDWVRIR